MKDENSTIHSLNNRDILTDGETCDTKIRRLIGISKYTFCKISSVLTSMEFSSETHQLLCHINFLIWQAILELFIPEDEKTSSNMNAIIAKVTWMEKVSKDENGHKKGRSYIQSQRDI